MSKYCNACRFNMVVDDNSFCPSCKGLLEHIKEQKEKGELQNLYDRLTL